MNINFEPLARSVTSQDIADYKKFRSQYKQKLGATQQAVISLLAIGFVVTPLVFFMLFGIIAAARINGVAGLILTILVFAVMSGLFFAIYYLYSLNRYKYEVKLYRFAQANNLIYEIEVGGVDLNYQGMIFKIGHSHRYGDRLKNQNGNVFEVSNFTYTTGYGKNSRTIENGYVMIGLDRNLPNIVLDSSKNNFNFLGLNVSNLPVNFKNNQKLSLEGDFNDYFTLYAPVGYKNDALYVFTPDLMALFIDNSSIFDAEIIDNKLFIYSRKFDLVNPVVLERIFKIIETVGAKTLSQTDYYTDERIGNRASDIVSVGGSRLKKQFVSAGVVVSIIIFILIIML